MTAPTPSDFPSLSDGQLYKTSHGNIVTSTEAKRITKLQNETLAARQMQNEPIRRTMDKLQEIKEGL